MCSHLDLCQWRKGVLATVALLATSLSGRRVPALVATLSGRSVCGGKKGAHGNGALLYDVDVVIAQVLKAWVPLHF